MAIGSEDTVVSGRYGRTSPPPHGSIYRRDEAAALAAAVKERVELFESLGLDVPEYLQAQAAEVADAAGDLIVKVPADEGTQDSWRLIGEADKAAAAAPVVEESVSVEEPVEEPAVEPAVEEPAPFEPVEVEETVDVVEAVEEEAPKPRRRTAKKADPSEG